MKTTLKTLLTAITLLPLLLSGVGVLQMTYAQSDVSWLDIQTCFTDPYYYDHHKGDSLLNVHGSALQKQSPSKYAKLTAMRDAYLYGDAKRLQTAAQLIVNEYMNTDCELLEIPMGGYNHYGYTYHSKDLEITQKLSTLFYHYTYVSTNLENYVKRINDVNFVYETVYRQTHAQLPDDGFSREQLVYMQYHFGFIDGEAYPLDPNRDLYMGGETRCNLRSEFKLTYKEDMAPLYLPVDNIGGLEILDHECGLVHYTIH